MPTLQLASSLAPSAPFPGVVFQDVATHKILFFSQTPIAETVLGRLAAGYEHSSSAIADSTRALSLLDPPQDSLLIDMTINWQSKWFNFNEIEWQSRFKVTRLARKVYNNEGRRAEVGGTTFNLSSGVAISL